MSRVLRVTVFAVLLVASAPSAQCPRGQELRENKFPGTKVVEARGCAKKDADGRDVREGTWVTFFPSGAKESEVTYKAGKMEGVATWYYENGNKRREYTYRDDKMDGPSTRWNEEGQQTSTALYKNDNLVKAP